MTTLCPIELHCPACGRDFLSTSWATSNTFGPTTTDFHQKASGFQALHFMIHTCSGCGLSGYESDFEQEPSPEVKQRIEAEIKPLVDDKLPPERRYEFAAWVAKWRLAGSMAVADLYLKGAWCAADRHKQAEETRLRRLALGHFRQAFQEGSVPDDERAIVAYLVGELYRRVGMAQQAGDWYDRAAEAAALSPEYDWLARLARGQKTEPKEFMEDTGAGS